MGRFARLACVLALVVAPWTTSVSAAQIAGRPSADTFILPEFTLAQLQKPDVHVLAQVQHAMTQLGAFVVLPEDTAGDAHYGALQSFVGCALGSGVTLQSTLMDDGTERRTVATSTTGRIPAPLPDAVTHLCPQFAVQAAQLRGAVDRVGRAYTRILDTLVYSDAAHFTAAADEADSLEHFHMFLRGSNVSDSDSDSAMLSLHTDVGAVLVMTVAEYTDLATNQRLSTGHPRRPGSTLSLQLADGTLVTPALPDGSFLVMNGLGASRWMPAGKVRPYAPPHEVASVQLGSSIARAWMGRMYFPVPTARPTPAPGEVLTPAEAAMTFREYRTQTYNAFKSGAGHLASTVGCAPAPVRPTSTASQSAITTSLPLHGQRQLLADEGSCGANEVYCWMSCMAISADISCTKSDIVCRNPSTGLIWPQDYLGGDGKPTHCFTCGLTCEVSAAGAPPSYVRPPSTSTFCATNLEPTTMWMTGFQFSTGQGDQPCVLFLFPTWVLDTKLKFGWACLGSFFMGVVTTGLQRVRRSVQHRLDAKAQAAKASHGNARTWRFVGGAVTLLLLAITLCLAYWCMLLAMTYQAEIFICVVLGLAVGHLYSIYAPEPTAYPEMVSKDGTRSSLYSKEDSHPEPCCEA